MGYSNTHTIVEEPSASPSAISLSTLDAKGAEICNSPVRTPAPVKHKALQASGDYELSVDSIHHRHTLAAEAAGEADLETASPPPEAVSQRVPPELPNFTAELILVAICSASLMLFSVFLGDVTVVQFRFQKALNLGTAEIPWLIGAYTTANGVSVVIAGSLADLTPPKALMVGAFCWLAVWNIVGCFTISPSRSVLFFIVRAMQGLAIGFLVSGAMSILGRVYKPGRRKNAVFSAMSAASPFGFYLGCLRAGALQAHLLWIFGSNAILAGILAVGAIFVIPPLRPVADVQGGERPSFRQFDFFGGAMAISGCVCVLFGLTQGTATSWAPYNYALIGIGLVALVGLFFVERRVARPLIPSRLWSTKGFTPLMIAYFLGYGGFAGAWQFYATQFLLRIHKNSPLIVALEFTPNAICGTLATLIVSKTIHKVPGTYIYVAAMLAYTLGPAFFLPQTPNTTYWALSMPGIALVTFGPDLSFAAASIFITSNVARSYQGSAGSLLVTNQNLSTAVMTSLADAIGTRVKKDPEGYIALEGLHAIWWFALGVGLIGALITAVWVRIPKEEEKEHVS